MSARTSSADFGNLEDLPVIDGIGIGMPRIDYCKSGQPPYRLIEISLLAEQLIQHARVPRDVLMFRNHSGRKARGCETWPDWMSNSRADNEGSRSTLQPQHGKRRRQLRSPE